MRQDPETYKQKSLCLKMIRNGFLPVAVKVLNSCDHNLFKWVSSTFAIFAQEAC